MLAALCFLLSCGGDDPLNEEPINPSNPEQPEKPEEPNTKIKRIKTLKVNRPSELYTEAKVTYDKQGRIVRIDSHIKDDLLDLIGEDWFNFGLSEYDAVTTITYQGKNVINKITCNGETYQQTLQLNDKGYVEKLFYKYNEEDRYNLFEYWENGNMKIGGNFAYQYSNGNITVADGGRYFCYLYEASSIPNKAGISPALFSWDYNSLNYSFLSSGIGFDIAVHNSFFLFYNGFYGKPSTNLGTSVAEKEDPYSLYYEYELDEDGYPTKIICTRLDNGMPIVGDKNIEAFTATIEYEEVK